MSDKRKPWEIPIQYTDDRFVEPTPTSAGRDESRPVEDLDADDIEERLRRPDVKEEREYECNDTTPINYAKGPHDDEFGVDGNAFDAPDDVPLDYENGPHDDEFGEDDEE